MDPPSLETLALASFHPVLAAVTLEQNREHSATRSALKDMPAVRMVAGPAASEMGRVSTVVVSYWSRDKTCLDKAVNAASSSSSLMQVLLLVNSNLGAAPMEHGLVHLSAVTTSLLMSIVLALGKSVNAKKSALTT